VDAPVEPASRQEPWRALVREASAFGVVGGVCVLLDLGLFQLLYAVLGVGAVLAKLVSSGVAALVAFAGHRSWSFAARARTGVRRELPAFLLVNALTLLVSLGIVALVRYPLGQTAPLVLQVANLTAIGVGTVIRFVAYRRWVFPAADRAAADRAAADRAAADRAGADRAGDRPASTG
jgi:putative flippase GtrA